MEINVLEVGESYQDIELAACATIAGGDGFEAKAKEVFIQSVEIKKTFAGKEGSPES